MATVSFHFLACFLLCFSLRLLIVCPDGWCREMTFPSFYYFAGKRLEKHNIKTLQVKSIDACEQLCYDEPNCVSINFEAIADDNCEYKCELSNSTHREHNTDFVDAPTHFYRGSKNACGSEIKLPCKHGGICQSGFTNKGYHCLCPSGFLGEHCERPERVGEAFLFSRKGNSDYVIIVDRMPSLIALTTCVWIKTVKPGTVLSYAVSGQYNELVIIISPKNSTVVHVGGEISNTGVIPTDGKWRHICATWENTAGSLKLYKDGKMETNVTRFNQGHEIPGGGSLVLGQKQDSVGGGIKKGYGFVGEMTGVNIWSRVLDDQEIRLLSLSCRGGEGNALKWSDFKNHTRGGVQLINVTCAA